MVSQECSESVFKWTQGLCSTWSPFFILPLSLVFMGSPRSNTALLYVPVQESATPLRTALGYNQFPHSGRQEIVLITSKAGVWGHCNSHPFPVVRLASPICSELTVIVSLGSFLWAPSAPGVPSGLGGGVAGESINIYGEPALARCQAPHIVISCNSLPSVTTVMIKTFSDHLILGSALHRY